MIYYALKSFSGEISMRAGEKRELADEKIIADLLRAGYIAEFTADEPKKAAKKGGKKNEQYKD